MSGITALSLCSRALIRIGVQPIASLDEGTAEADIAAKLYPDIRDALLSSHPWTFATRRTALVRLAATPVADFAHAFQLPVDFLRAISAVGDSGGRVVPYRITEDRLHASKDRITLTYIFRPKESAFPAFFASALVARLTAEFCISITESALRAELLFRLAESELRGARLADEQHQGSVP